MAAPIDRKSVRKANLEKFNKRNDKRMRKKLAKITKSCDKQINKDYMMWTPVEDMRRSFWVWKGKFSDSPKETEIAKIFKNQKLRFFREVSFDLKRRFDFYIPLIDLVIEYDGKQHFNSTIAIYKDIAKDNLLKKHGVKLIRYNRTHDLENQIQYDLVNHPILKQNIL